MDDETILARGGDERDIKEYAIQNGAGLSELAVLQQQAREKFAGILNCINSSCDQNGSIPHQVSEDEWEAEQCQYCFEIRFPALNVLHTLIASAYHAGKERAVEYIADKSKEHTSLFEELAYRADETPLEETFVHIKMRDLKAARNAE